MQQAERQSHRDVRAECPNDGERDRNCERKGGDHEAPRSRVRIEPVDTGEGDWRMNGHWRKDRAVHEVKLDRATIF